MSEEILPGDLVQLKSGGPTMAIGEINGFNATCYWFHRTDPMTLTHNDSTELPHWQNCQEKTFPLSALRKIQELVPA